MANPNIAATVGTYLSIALGAPATEDQAGYENVSLTYQEIGETGEIGEFGGVRQIVEWINTKDGVVQKRGGSINYGTLDFPIAQDATDAGQAACQSALDGANAGQIHSVKLYHPTYGDIYFQVIVTGYTYSAGGANDMFGGSVTMELTSKLVVVDRV